MRIKISLHFENFIAEADKTSKKIYLFNNNTLIVVRCFTHDSEQQFGSFPCLLSL